MKKTHDIEHAFTPHPAAATPTDTLSVVVARDYELQRKFHYRRLGIAYASLDVPRREFPDMLADTIYLFEGRISWPNGAPFELSDTGIDDAFGNDDSFRWLSDFKNFVEVPPKQRPQRRILARLRLVDLYFRIKHPERAMLIAK